MKCLKIESPPNNIILIAMSVWILGFFLIPFSKQHYQVFIATIVLSAFWLIFTMKINYKALVKSKVLIVSFIYAILFFISISWSNDEWFSDKFKDVKTFLYLIFFAFVFLYAIDGKSSRLSSLITYLIIAAVFSLIINFYFFYGVNDKLITARFSGLGRLWNPLWAAAMYGGMALITLFILLNKYASLKLSIKCTLLLSYILFVLAVFLTQSRTPIFAVVLMSFVAVFFSNNTLKAKVIFLTISISIAVILLVLFFPVIYEYTMIRGQSHRLDLWLEFIERAREHLIFGHGGGSKVAIYAPGEFGHGWYHYHSVYIGSLVELGLVGLLLHFVIIFTVLNTAWRLRDNFYVRAAVLVFIYACIIGITFAHGILTRMNTQWLLFWMPLLIIAMYEIKNNGISVRNNV